MDSPLFHNTALRKRISLADARSILDWMSLSEEVGGGGKRAEWIGAGKSSAWVWWRRPEEWAELVLDWVCHTAFLFLVWVLGVVGIGC